MIEFLEESRPLSCSLFFSLCVVSEEGMGRKSALDTLKLEWEKKMLFREKRELGFWGITRAALGDRKEGFRRVSGMVGREIFSLYSADLLVAGTLCGCPKEQGGCLTVVEPGGFSQHQKQDRNKWGMGWGAQGTPVGPRVGRRNVVASEMSLQVPLGAALPALASPTQLTFSDL